MDNSTDSSRFTRRQFLRSAGVAAGAITGGVSFCEASDRVELGVRKASSMIDTNVWLSQSPSRRLPLDDTGALVAKLRSQRVSEAWAGTFDGILHKDLGSANARLARECQQHGRGVLVPFGTVNPQLPDWEEELHRCHEDHRMRGIRLHPNYHGYKLDEPVFGKLLDAVTMRGLVLQIALSMEDERMQHPLMQVPHMDASPLLGALKDCPHLKVVLLNWFRAVKGDLIEKLAKAGQVYFEIATVEGVNGVGNLIKQVPPERVLFGSYAPFFYFESAALKLKESLLNKRELDLIRRENSRRISQVASRKRNDE